MIKLKKSEEVEVFQVELSIKVKTKQSPFIAVLILTEEQGEISAESLQQTLLTSLPQRACENLLQRLEQQGYLIKSNHYGHLQKQGDIFKLTEIGAESAVNKSFWIGEKGLYNVFVSKSGLIQQRIIKTEKVEKAEDDKNYTIIETPKDIIQYEKQILSINKNEILIEDVERRCFQLKPADCILEIQADENDCILKLARENKVLFQTDLDFDESAVKTELLTACNQIAYHTSFKAVLASFSKDDLSFKRKVVINRPLFQQISFDPTELENIHHIPIDIQVADLWYLELLYKNIRHYFLDEISFDDFASETAKPIQPYYKIQIPKRKELVELQSDREDAFYQIAKLETIDYLTF